MSDPHAIQPSPGPDESRRVSVSAHGMRRPGGAGNAGRRGEPEAGRSRRVLVVRIGSMGDVIHALPAVASLKQSLAGCHLAWLIDPKWAVLLEANPYVDEVIPFDRRRLRSVWRAVRTLRREPFDTVADFQGLIKSAVAASLARPRSIYGFHQSQLREKPAALFYSHRIRAAGPHVVDMNLELARAAGASNTVRTFPLPQGRPEGELPEGEFVLASPLGGWKAKQWPLENYAALARLIGKRLGIPLVLNGPPGQRALLESVEGCRAHCSSVAGLIDATRRAAAVVGIDSGPLHLAAALAKPGVALFGPTDPERNGPYGDSFTVLRAPGAATSYKRRQEIDASMRALAPEEVFAALEARLERAAGGAA